MHAQTYRILTLGDSITATIQGNYNSSYQKKLRDDLSAAGVSFSFVGPNGSSPNQHGGFSGQGIDNVRDHLVSDLNASFGSSPAPSGTVNVVCVMLGINNMNHGLGISGSQATNFPPNNGSGTAQAIAPQFANPSNGSHLRGLGLSWGSSPPYDVWVLDQVTQLLETITTHGSKPRVIVGSVLPVGLGNPSYQANTNNCVERIKELNQMYIDTVSAQAAKGRNIRFVENFNSANRSYGVGTDWGTSTRQTADWVHPDNNSPILATVGANFAAAVQNSSVTNVPLINGGFEDTPSQNPNGWSSWANTAANYSADFSQAYWPQSGSNNGAHWSGAGPYQVYTYQGLTLDNGNYRASTWAAGATTQTGCNFNVKDYGGPQRNAAINTSWYSQLTINNIQVTNGAMTIGFWSNANAANQWAVFDDVKLERVD